MGVYIFKAGDHVRLKSCVHEEGIIFACSEDFLTENCYFIAFCMGTEYEAKPWVKLVHADELILIEAEIHKKKDPPKFMKSKSKK